MAWRGMADYQGQYSAFSRLLVSVFFFCLIKMCYFGSDVLRYSTWATVSFHHRLSYILTVELTFTFEMGLLKGSSRLSLSFLSPPTSIFLLQHLHSSNHNFVTNWFFFYKFTTKLISKISHATRTHSFHYLLMLKSTSSSHLDRNAEPAMSGMKQSTTHLIILLQTKLPHWSI